MACARRPGSTQLMEIQDASWGVTKGSIAFAIAIDALLCLNPSVLFGSVSANVFHLRPSLKCRSKKQSLHSRSWPTRGVRHGFQLAANPSSSWSQFQRTHVAWAPTYQTMCLVVHPEQLRLEAFWLPKPKKISLVAFLPYYFQNDWNWVSHSSLTGFKRHIDGTEMAGWRIAAVSPDNVSEICAAQFRVIPGIRRI